MPYIAIYEDCKNRKIAQTATQSRKTDILKTVVFVQHWTECNTAHKESGRFRRRERQCIDKRKVGGLQNGTNRNEGDPEKDGRGIVGNHV